MAGALTQRVMLDLGYPRVAPQVWHAPPVDFDARLEVAVSRAVRQTVTRAAALFFAFGAFALLGLIAGAALPPLLDSSGARPQVRVEEAVPNAAQVQPLFVSSSEPPRPAKQPAPAKPIAIDNILEDAL